MPLFPKCKKKIFFSYYGHCFPCVWISWFVFSLDICLHAWVLLPVLFWNLFSNVYLLLYFPFLALLIMCTRPNVSFLCLIITASLFLCFCQFVCLWTFSFMNVSWACLVLSHNIKFMFINQTSVPAFVSPQSKPHINVWLMWPVNRKRKSLNQKPQIWAVALRG